MLFQQSSKVSLSNYVLNDQINLTHTASILKSKQEIQKIERSSSDATFFQQTLTSVKMNRQIVSDMIVDWKQYDKDCPIKSRLEVKNSQNNQNKVFSFFVQKQENGEPTKVIYKWMRRPQHSQQIGIYLIEQQHFYRGQMKNKRKHGQGQYIVTKRFSDNLHKQTCIIGVWECDVLRSGMFYDQLGNSKQINRSLTNFKSSLSINPFSQRNKAVRLQSQLLGKKKTVRLMDTLQKGRESIKI